jgi:hypothetical protein
VTYACPDTHPRDECGQSRQRKDAILRRQEEAATTDQLKTIDIRATVDEAGRIRKVGKSQASHGRSLPSSNEGGGREKKRHILYKRVKYLTEPKNKREETCGQSISDINAWNAPSSSLQKLLVNTSPILQNRGKMLPTATCMANPWKQRPKPTQKVGQRNSPARRRRINLPNL